DLVHLVAKDDAGDFVLVALSPHRLGPRLRRRPGRRYALPADEQPQARVQPSPHTAPSSTRKLRSTSIVKSTWPGVSMMLRRLFFQKAVVAAEVIVMPRSCSCSIQSMVAAPSCTSPILWLL